MSLYKVIKEKVRPEEMEGLYRSPWWPRLQESSAVRDESQKSLWLAKVTASQCDELKAHIIHLTPSA